MGKVYLVGAGPGDPELLTLKAERLLKDAEVVVYDRLISSEILNLINKDAKMIDVGKNAGYHKVKQSEINEILVREGKKSDKVIRLKGGDPFIFGRAGEEIEALIENGVDFEEVPGITSALAASSYAGIPLTHRDYASSVHIITGHLKNDAELQLDFDALVRLEGTLIFLMSVKTAGFLANGLIKAGMDGNYPSAVIERGTLNSQRKFKCGLKDLEKTIEENKIISPAIIMVGKVCELDYDWFGKLPLKGSKFLTAMPYRRNSKMAGLLRGAGAVVEEYHTFDIEFIRPINPPVEDYDVLIFTSTNGVESFFEDYYKEHDARGLYEKKIAAVGKATAEAIKKFSIKADFIPKIYTGENLAKEMLEQKFIDKTNRILLLRAELASKGITDIFREAEIEFEDYPVYRTRPIESGETDFKDLDAVVFTSSQSVKSFALNNDYRGKALVIGEKTAKTAKEYGFDIIISDEATMKSMLEKAKEVWHA